jgi:hypothetical protein
MRIPAGALSLETSDEPYVNLEREVAAMLARE